MSPLSICLKAIYCLGIFCILPKGQAQPGTSYPATDSIPLSVPFDKNQQTTNTEITRISASGRQYVRRVNQPKLLAYYPAGKQQDKRAAVIICPGGGYAQLMIGDEGAAIARRLNKVGVVAFVLKYSTSEKGSLKNPALPLAEAQEAIALIRQHAGEWNIDGGKIGIMGFSAGGHLAALTSVKFDTPEISTDESVRPDFTVLIYPVVSFLDRRTSRRSKTRLNLLGPHPGLIAKEWFSPEIQIRQNTPPAFIVHAADDSTALVQNSLAYYRELVENKIPVRAVFYEKGGHGFGIFNKVEKTSWIGDLIHWMELNHFIAAFRPT